MTGRRLYEIVTDELRRYGACVHADAWNGEKIDEPGYGTSNFHGRTPPAFAFLTRRERDSWNAAARRVTGKRRA